MNVVFSFFVDMWASFSERIVARSWSTGLVLCRSSRGFGVDRGLKILKSRYFVLLIIMTNTMMICDYSYEKHDVFCTIMIILMMVHRMILIIIGVPACYGCIRGHVGSLS